MFGGEWVLCTRCSQVANERADWAQGGRGTRHTEYIMNPLAARFPPLDEGRHDGDIALVGTGRAPPAC